MRCLPNCTNTLLPGSISSQNSSGHLYVYRWGRARGKIISTKRVPIIKDEITISVIFKRKNNLILFLQKI
jgi:hypothetical protein